CRLIRGRLQETNFAVRRSHANGIETDKFVPSLCPTRFRGPINLGISGKNVHQDRENGGELRPLMSSHTRQIDKLAPTSTFHQAEQPIVRPAVRGDRPENGISYCLRHNARLPAPREWKIPSPLSSLRPAVWAQRSQLGQIAPTGCPLARRPNSHFFQ